MLLCNNIHGAIVCTGFFLTEMFVRVSSVILRFHCTSTNNNEHTTSSNLISELTYVVTEDK